MDVDTDTGLVPDAYALGERVVRLPIPMEMFDCEREVTARTADTFDPSLEHSMGVLGENIFRVTAAANGYPFCEQADPMTDMRKHIDCFIRRTAGSAPLSVDVKGEKCMSRGDADSMRDHVWIELHGKAIYSKGWLYGGYADYIAFVMKQNIYGFTREYLMHIIHELVDRTKVVSRTADALNCVYARGARLSGVGESAHDTMTLVSIHDLVSGMREGHNDGFVWRRSLCEHSHI